MKPARLLTGFGWTVVALLGTVLLVVALVLQSAPGQRFALRLAVGQIDRQLQGELTVEGIRSSGLLRGFTLTGISVVGEDGAMVLEADSLRLGYRWTGFLNREAYLAPVELWSPHLVFDAGGEGGSNLERLLPPPSPAPPRVGPAVPGAAGDGPAFRVELSRVSIRNGRVTLRLPLNGAPLSGAERKDGPTGPFQEVALYAVEARIRSAVLLDPKQDGERVVLEHLSFSVPGDDVPLHIRALSGSFARTDGRLVAEGLTLELPETRLTGGGELRWAPGAETEVAVAFEAHRFAARDLAWLDPRLPPVTGGFTLQVEGPLRALSLTAPALDLALDEARLQGRFQVELADGLRFANTNLEATGFDLSLADPWLPEPLPVQGVVNAQVTLSGPLDALETEGRIRYGDPARGIAASEANFSGRLRFDEGAVSVAGGRIEIPALDYGTLRAFVPNQVFQGAGSLLVDIDGGLAQGVELQARVQHRSPSGARSSVSVAGDVRPLDSGIALLLRADLDSLSLDGIAQGFALDLPVSGWVRGPLTLQGALDALALEGELEVEGGTLQVMAEGNLLDPRTDAFRLSINTDQLVLPGLIPQAPEGSVVRGTMTVSGLDGVRAQMSESEASARSVATGLGAWEGVVALSLGESAWGEWRLHALEVQATADAGMLQVETFRVTAEVGTAEGRGSLGLAPGYTGVFALSFELRDLTPLDVSGQVTGVAELRGHLEALTLEGSLEGTELEGWGARAGRLQSQLQGSMGRNGEGTDPYTVEDVRIQVSAEAVTWGRFDFDEVQLLGTDLGPSGGGIEVDLRRSDEEHYHLDGRVALESGGGFFDLHAVRLDLDPVVWTLQAPARITWSDRTFTFAPIEIGRRSEDAPVRIQVAGQVDLEGPLDLRVEGVGVDLERFARILQITPAPSGTLDLSLHLTGNADNPRVEGELDLRAPQYAGTQFGAISGAFQFRDQRLDAAFEVTEGERRVFTSTLRYPLNLALGEGVERFPVEPVDLVFQFDSLPAANLLAQVEALDQVQGMLDGEVRVTGVPGALELGGVVRLVNGGLTLPEIGIAPSAIEATFTLLPDSRIQIAGTGRSRGSVRLDGVIDLSDLADPGFDLRIRADGFQAVERRDLEARITGEVTLGGRYQEPVVGGRILVDRGNMFLEELVRTAEVVDLTLTFGLGELPEGIDDPLRAVTEAAFNPFLEGLRVDVELSMQRDVWLRSREMNVEMAGDLIVTFDRPKREILLVGSVNAVRGSYSAFGRAFQVRSGTVDFIGAPGINPRMDIEAVHRLRQQGGQPLDIIARLEGTLLAPRIRLTSAGDPPIAESDLISYLIFGRPSYLLGSGETSVLQGATGALVSGATGLLASQLSAVVGQQIGLDFFAITQAQEGADMGAETGLTRGLVDTQVEIGQYVTENIFLGIVLRPLRGIDGAQSLPGARMEWRFADQWSFTAYVEDRLGRDGVAFGNLGVRTNRILGIDLFREWGY